MTLEFDKISRTPSTRPAHRAIRHIQNTQGLEATEAFVEALFQAYFTEGRDIGKIEVLLDIATSVRVNPDTLWAMFESDSYIEEVNAEDLQAREMGMGGVPGFIVNRKYFLSGAQPAPAFHKLFDLIISEAKHS